MVNNRPRPPVRCQRVYNREHQPPPEWNHRRNLRGAWGHCLRPKTEGFIRILFHNMGGIGTDSESKISNFKMEKLKKLTIEQRIDIIGIAEVNVDWRLVRNKLNQRIQRWFNIVKTVTSFNHAYHQECPVIFSQEVQRQSQITK